MADAPKTSVATRAQFILALRKVLTGSPLPAGDVNRTAGLRIGAVSNIFDLVKKTPEKMANPSERRVWIGEGGPVTFRVRGELDITTDAVLVDHKLGTVALIHWLGETTTERIEKDIRRILDRAAYLRHLLTQEARTVPDDHPGKTPFCVEVVFGIAGESAEQVLGSILHQILRDSAHVHTLGVNVWRHDGKGGFEDPQAVRRAFSWLLVGTERWLEEQVKNNVSFHDMTELELKNFRLPGTRSWRLGPSRNGKGSRFHVVHGHNGSGKTSLGEALELLVSGTVQRIQNVVVPEHRDHIAVLKCRFLDQDARVALKPKFESPNGNSPERILHKGGIDNPLGPGFPAEGFRMHQTLGDELSQAGPARRAELLLKAFFPADRDELNKQADARKRLESGLAQIPPNRTDLIGPAGKASAKELYGLTRWMASPQVSPEPALPWDKVRSLLPLRPQVVETLLPILDPSFVSLWQRSEPMDFAGLLEAGVTFEKGLISLAERSARLMEVLSKTQEILVQFGGPLVRQSQDSQRELEDLLNEWLELVALSDLLAQEKRALNTISAARSAGYDFPTSEGPLLAAYREQPAEREYAYENVVHRLNSVRDSLETWGRRDAYTQSGESLPELSAFSLGLLDEAARSGALGIQFRQTSIPLSTALREAVQQRRLVRVASYNETVLTIGAPDWAKTLQANVEAMMTALREVLGRRDELMAANGQFTKLLPSLRQVADAARELADADDQVERNFLARIGPDGPLAPALNELMAMMTPARWSYEDVVTKVKVNGESREMDLSTGGMPSNLRLNTAELNLMALSLFLLGAPANPNPLRFIVLDDPLQNMDELTVTTVARGLGRLLRLWDRMAERLDGWRLIVLLHGEDNVERLRDEVPCITHFLPWLSPSRTGGSGDNTILIKNFPSRLSQDLQPLEKLFSAPPAEALQKTAA